MENFVLLDSASEFVPRMVLSQRVSEPQPFGAIGGMPRTCELLALQLGMSRVHIDYTLNAVQNCNMLVIAQRAAENSDNDALVKCTQYAAALDDTRKQLASEHDNFNTVLTSHLATDCSEPAHWIPASSVGRYGSNHMEILTALQTAQQSAYAFETCTANSIKTPVNSFGFATVCFEKLPDMEIRSLRTEEAAAAVNFIVNSADSCIALANEELRWCKPAFRWVLEQRVKEWEGAKAPLNDSVRQQYCNELLKLDLGAAGRVVRAAGAPGNVLHLSVVIGHPGNKGAGRAAMEKVCELADELKLPVILEALPNDRLPVYYATTYGFFGVNVGNTSSQRSGFILMWREPKEREAGAGSSADAERLAAAMATAESLDKLPKYSVKGRSSKLDHLHLSPATINHLKHRLVYNSKKVLLSYATWAKEYARQVIAGCITSSYSVPSEDQIVALEEAEDTPPPVPKAVSTRPARRAREDEDESEVRPSQRPKTTITAAPPPPPPSTPPPAQTTGTVTIPMASDGSRGNVVLYLTNCTVNIYLNK